MSKLELYKSTNFTNCLNDNSFYANPEFLLKHAHFCAIISIPTNLFGLYCILYRTPKVMGEMKYCLLNLQIWTFLLDLSYLLLIVPFYFLPVSAYCYLGFLSKIGVPSSLQHYIDHALAGGIAAANLLLFENRHHSIVPMTSRFRIDNYKLRVLIFTINFFLGCPALIPTLFLNNNTEELKLEMLTVLPCPDKLFFDKSTFAVQNVGETLSILISTGTALLFAEGAFYIGHCVYHVLKWQNSTAGVTNQAKAMQRTFFIASCIQVLIPFLVIVVPTLFISYAMVDDKFNQTVLDFITISISLHGTVATLALILVNKPYRSFVQGLFIKRRPAPINVTSISSTNIVMPNYSPKNQIKTVSSSSININ